MNKEQRQYIRIKSLNLSYVCIDENNVIINEGMGRTLNVSESGILLETHFPINLTHFLTLTVALEDDLVDIRGKVVHCSTCEDGKYQTGVQFLNQDRNIDYVLQEFIKLFKEQRK